MQPKLPVLIFVLFFSNYLNAQQDSLLRKYKYRTPGYTGVTLTGNSSNNFSDQANGATSLNNSVGINVFGIKSTQKLQQNFTIAFSPTYSFNKQSNGFTNKEKSFAFFLLLEADNKYFKGSRFLEWQFSSVLGLGNGKNYNSTESIKSNGVNTNNILTLGIGKGRIENVSDMQMALRMQQSLQQNGLINLPLSNDAIDGLAKVFTRVSNTRVFDFRKKYAFALKEIDNYLGSIKGVSRNNIEYFTTINDIWALAVNYNRLSGKEKFIKLIPGIFYANSNRATTPFTNTTNDLNTSQNGWQINLLTGFNNYKPLSLRLQQNTGITLFANYAVHHQKDLQKQLLGNTAYVYNDTINRVGIWAYYEYQFYPSTRATMGVKASLNTGYQDYNSLNNFYISPSINCFVNYLINYRTSIKASVFTGVNEYNLLYSPYNNSFYSYGYYGYNYYAIPSNRYFYARAAVELLVNLR